MPFSLMLKISKVCSQGYAAVKVWAHFGGLHGAYNDSIIVHNLPPYSMSTVDFHSYRTLYIVVLYYACHIQIFVCCVYGPMFKIPSS